MRPRKPIREEDKKALKGLLQEAKSKPDFQRVQSVWLRAVFNMTAPEISEATGLKKSTVDANHFYYFSEGISSLGGVGRGGRHRENLTKKEEEDLLYRFKYKSGSGSVLVVSEIKKAYEEIVGRTVPESTVYRMLSRHGWRKIMPRPVHPKNDPDAIVEFKKNFPGSLKKK